MTHESAEDEQQPTLPLQGQISRVTGRRSQGGSRGLPAIDHLSLAMGDGTTLDFGRPGRGQAGTLEIISAIEPNAFQRDGTPCCPICIDGDPTDKEHVPQQNLGGRVMTMTCKACNNGLGSRVEADLQDWFDHAYRWAKFEHEDVRGPRRVPTIYHRQAVDGAFAMVFDGELTPELLERFSSGQQFNMHFRPPDPRRYSLALLKHAYLAACLYLKHVPDTEETRAIRADLVAARDTPTRSRPTESRQALRLKVYRSDVGTQGPPLALVARFDDDDDAEPEVLISLAGVLFVSWPFADLAPGHWQRAAPEVSE